MILKEKGSERRINCPLSTAGIALSTVGIVYRPLNITKITFLHVAFAY
jgi:hypothetical protein